MFLLTWWAKWPLLTREYQNELLKICLSITIPIFVIGIAVTTLAHRLGESGQLTAEYLHKSCRLPVFTCQSYFSVLLAVAAILFPLPDFNQEASPLAYIALGSTVVIIPFFLFIVATLIRCANPQKAIEVATKFSTTWLENAFAKDAYSKISKELPKKKKDTIKAKCQPPPDEEWENHLAKVQNAFEKAVNDHSLEGIQAWLNCTIEPIHRVFEICQKLPQYQRSTDYDPTRLYKMIEMYELALIKLLVLEKKAHLWFVERGIHRVVKAVHNEVRRLFNNKNYTSLRPLCWIVVRLYKRLLDSEYSNELGYRRAYFGGFYKFIPYHLKDLPDDCPPETKSVFRQIFHEGIMIWLQSAIKHNDEELVESLCDAARDIIFTDETTVLKHDKALIQHLVLIGKLISDGLEKKHEIISPKNLEHLLPNVFKNSPLNLGDLVNLYNENRPTVSTDLYRFVQELGDAWERTHYDPLIGSSWSSGTRYHGGILHLDTGFLYAAALILQINPKPNPIPVDMTNLKARLSELQTNHVKLEAPGCHMMQDLFGFLDTWINDSKKQKDEQRNNPSS
jgi:hypothetical protein